MKALALTRIFLIISLIASSVYFSYRSFSQDYIGTIAGHIYFAKIDGQQQTGKWGGIVGIVSGTLEESPYSFGYIPIDTATIYTATFPGENFQKGKYYFMATTENITFNITKVENVTINDLEEFGIFNQSNFPVFHPNYYVYSDNPKNTFCPNGYCTKEDIMLDGKWFNAIVITLKQNTKYYLLKYKLNSTTEIPLFLVFYDDYSGYDNNYYNFQFMLPIGKTYYFYIISKEPAYKLETWIDGTKTDTFQQTALPYNLTIRVTGLYTGFPIENISVMAFEENGNNIFIPKRLSGLISRGFSVATTDENGFVQFIVAPTEYPTTPDYSIGVGIFSDSTQEVIRRVNLTLTNSLSIERQKKSFSPSNLLDNAKVSVNAMNQIISSLYKWANEEQRALVYQLVYDIDTGSYYFRNLTDYQIYPNVTVKTGAPNVFTVSLQDSSGNPVSGYVRVREKNGYLLFSPTYNPPVISNKTNYHDLFYIPSDTQFIIAPTSYGDANSQITIDIYDVAKRKISSVPLAIDKSLEPRTGGIPFQDDDMKVIINAMNSVGYSLYYSLN